MKISKSLLQALAIAVTVALAESCTKQPPVDPNQEIQKQPYNCPACGMG
jgi:hypothetical protein